MSVYHGGMKTKNTPILVLNKHYFPVDVGDVRDVIGNIWSGSMHPLDIYYDEDDHGCIDEENISYWNVIRGPEDWMELPIRPYDDYIQTAKGPVRLPTVVTCANYEGIHYKKVMFPTKHNIHKRDNYTCGYTGKKLTKDELSIDHIFPKVRCSYNPNTWENQICCHRELNTWKADRLPEECDLRTFDPVDPWLKEWKATQGKTLKLLWYPKKPKQSDVFASGDTMESWNTFLKNL